MKSTERIGEVEQWFFNFEPGTIGCWSPSAIGVALSEALRGESHALYIGRKESPMTHALRENPILIVNGEKREIHEHFSVGLIEAYRRRRLPEVAIVGCTPDKLDDFCSEFIELAHEIDQREGIESLFHIQQLPIFIFVSNGIYYDSLIEKTRRSLNKNIGEKKTQVILEHMVRGTAYVSATREGEYEEADYKTEGKGAVVLSGGSGWARERAAYYSQNSTVKLTDGKEDVLQAELQKAYTTLMTNVLALSTCYDHRHNQPNLEMPVGRILFHRLPITDGPAYPEIEGIRDFYIQTGKSFFEIAQALGKFSGYPSWESFDEQRFLKPLREGKRAVDFYGHIPSSIQHIERNVKSGRQSSGQYPPSEAAVLDPMISFAKEHNLAEATKTLENLKTKILTNIEAVYQAYREPRMVNAVPGTIETVLGDSRDVSFVKVAFPEAIGLSEAEIRPFLALGTNPQKDGYIVPMSAAVFAYGPEKILGTVALITNGAGFAVDFLDQAVAAGVRPGFISDLRLNFAKDKFYLAIKMALAANPKIKTVAVNVLSTLTTAKDVALAIERISHEHTDMQFVVKLEAVNQREGFALLRKLKKQKRKVLLVDTQEHLIWHVRNLEGTAPDRYYKERYGEISEGMLHERLLQSFEKRMRFLLTPEALSLHAAEEINALEAVSLMSFDAVFGDKFRPAIEGKSFFGTPIVAIYGYGRTSLAQAKLIKKAGTEVVIVHPKATRKIDGDVQKELAAYGIPVMSHFEELQKAITTHYRGQPPDILGLIYEPYSPGVETGNGALAYKERIETATKEFIGLKTHYGLPLRSILIPTEMVPTSTTKILLQLARESEVWFIGPNAPGATRTFEGASKHVKLGQIPEQVVAGGNVLACGVSGTLLFETLAILKKHGLGISAALSLGGDKTRGLSARDAALMAEKDERTKYIVYLDEPGGMASQELAELMRAGRITKPVIAKVTGRSLPDNCYVGHAGSVTYGSTHERAIAKIEVLEQVGAMVVDTPEQMVQVVKFLDSHPKLGRIDIHSPAFLQAKKMLAAAQELVMQAMRNITGEMTLDNS